MKGTAKAKADLAADQRKREAAAQKGIEAVMKRHRVLLVPVPQILPDGRVSASLMIRAKD